ISTKTTLPNFAPSFPTYPERIPPLRHKFPQKEAAKILVDRKNKIDYTLDNVISRIGHALSLDRDGYTISNCDIIPAKGLRAFFGFWRGRKYLYDQARARENTIQDHNRLGNIVFGPVSFEFTTSKIICFHFISIESATFCVKCRAASASFFWFCPQRQ